MCFSLQWIEQLCIYLVIIFAIVGIIKLLIPFVTQALGSAGPVVGQILTIVLYAIIAIMVVYIIFGLLGCLIGMGGGFSLMPPHR